MSDMGILGNLVYNMKKREGENISAGDLLTL